ncbi:hypothetical protein JHK82_053462 [Glycine max]|uniref:Retrotransposon Copia-like N-terminal domain-containing protein n=1 Tax=Glycine max TaxID=3847 RepID=A0A0R0ELD9_SOYBN|nr:hypothetical protein JHK86_053314 [Glycine max]KAG4927768.1 hypothetical protein JHK85_054254 [Glycine max]KAG5083293.1 hypothetical protein JHK84_053331 [Glycine max]KAG5086065.1 hypothetical protein JHK82_053462 [Glycine max]KAH1077590.1 hypothetical protein GYH30_052901 [Glycine max]
MILTPLFFILHSSDNLDIALVSHPLVGENYNSWKKAMHMALHGKNKYGFVNGTIHEPALGHSTHALWHRNDSIVSSCLVNSLSKKIQVSILHCSSAKAIWDDIQERFEQRNGPLIFQLKHDLITLLEHLNLVGRVPSRPNISLNSSCIPSLPGVPTYAHGQHDMVAS